MQHVAQQAKIAPTTILSRHQISLRISRKWNELTVSLIGLVLCYDLHDRSQDLQHRNDQGSKRDRTKRRSRRANKSLHIRAFGHSSSICRTRTTVVPAAEYTASKSSQYDVGDHLRDPDVRKRREEDQSCDFRA